MRGRDRRKENNQQTLIGGASLLTIFSVLCMTVFALLSLSTVQVGTRLTDSEINAIENYYDADCEAERILTELRRGNVEPSVELTGDTYNYSVPVSDTQELQAEIAADGSYRVIRWQLVPTVAWESDSQIEFWDGQ